MITTVHSSQAELLAAVAALHNEGLPFHCDLTYGSGGFWRDAAAALEPTVRMDLEPQWKAFKKRPDGAVDFSVFQEWTNVNVQADLRALPFRAGSIRSALLDPPFLHAHGKESVIGNRFSSYPSQRALREMYWQALREIQRCLAPGGLLVFKCMDIVESGKQVWNHTDIMSNARALGLSPIDLFILVRDPKHAMVGWNHQNQQHARKVHTFWWVFRKETTKLEQRPRPAQTKKENTTNA